MSNLEATLDTEELNTEELDPGIENESVDGDDDSVIINPFDPKKIRVERETPTIDLLIKRIKHDEINLSPDFQRKGGIWTNEAQSRLIESILIRIPLPAFYIDATDDEQWLVVDGLQRLTTLRRFVLDDQFALEGLEFLTDLNGKTYNQLPRNLQRRIEETAVTLFLIQPGTPAEVKFNIFKRINTGGLPLSAQEIRNAINGDRVREFILELTDLPSFKSATQSALSDKRMADRECVVRFLAFHINNPNSYKGRDFDGFLNEVMERLDDPDQMDESQLEPLKIDFDRSMKAAKAIFRVYAFRKYYGPECRKTPINKALFESISTNLSKLSDEEILSLEKRREEVLKKLAILHKNNDFIASISQGTGVPARIRKRFDSIKTLFKEVLSNDQED